MDKLDSIIAASTILGQSNLQAIDTYGDITVQHFVDLLSAVHGGVVLEVISQALTAVIRDQIVLSEYDAVVCPKLGNTLLGHRVSSILRKPSGFVRHSILFDRYIETCQLPGSRMLLVDDVSSEASILTDCIRNGRAGGFFIDRVFTVVNRIEGDAREKLKRLGVELFSCRELRDRDLASLVQAWKAQEPSVS